MLVISPSFYTEVNMMTSFHKSCHMLSALLFSPNGIFQYTNTMREYSFSVVILITWPRFYRVSRSLSGRWCRQWFSNTRKLGVSGLTCPLI